MSSSIHAIPSLEDWKNLPGKSHRKDILIALRREFDDLDIREVWNMKPATYYNIISRYGLGGMKERRLKDDEGRSVNSAPRKREFRFIDQENAQPAQHENVYGESSEVETQLLESEEESAPSEPRPPKKRPGRKPGVANKKDPAKPQQQAAKPPAPAQAAEIPQLAFPIVRGKPAQLRKQLEAVVMFLEAMEDGEESHFEIRISAAKV